MIVMPAITADSNMHSVLSQVTGVTEVRDSAGNVMGTYTPNGKADEGANKQLLLICFEDGASVLFDLKQAREVLAREKDRARPFRAVIAELEQRASQQA